MPGPFLALLLAAAAAYVVVGSVLAARARDMLRVDACRAKELFWSQAGALLLVGSGGVAAWCVVVVVSDVLRSCCRSPRADWWTWGTGLLFWTGWSAYAVVLWSSLKRNHVGPVDCDTWLALDGATKDFVILWKSTTCLVLGAALCWLVAGGVLSRRAETDAPRACEATEGVPVASQFDYYHSVSERRRPAEATL